MGAFYHIWPTKTTQNPNNTVWGLTKIIEKKFFPGAGRPENAKVLLAAAVPLEFQRGDFLLNRLNGPVRGSFGT